MTKRMVITGASGFVGKQLVPRLEACGIDLLLVGRDAQKLKVLFPGMAVCTYEDLAEHGAGFDALVHLAILNNDRPASADAFEKVNVGFLLETVGIAKAAGIRTFVNVSTFHALDAGKSPYAQSKRQGANALDDVEGIHIVNLFLPAVYGDDFAGKLKVLKRLPRAVRQPVLTFLAAMVPTLHVDRLAEFFAEGIEDAEPRALLADPQEENPVYRIGKRAIDLGFALTVLVVFWWLLAAIWLAVILTSKGQGIFAQERIGRFGKPFTCYKFRTMQVGTRQAGTHEVSASAVTAVGRFLRKFKLDELPQVWNILCGELSLVGPRPCLLSQNELIEARRRRVVLKLIPGVTGLAQTRGIDMSTPDLLAQVDADYASHRTLCYDIRLVLRTLSGAGRGDQIRT